MVEEKKLLRIKLFEKVMNPASSEYEKREAGKLFDKKDWTENDIEHARYILGVEKIKKVM